MTRNLRYQLIKSVVQRQQAQRKQDFRMREFEKEISKIEGEDPLCTPKKSSKNT
jgi:hypothetical protein